MLNLMVTLRSALQLLGKEKEARVKSKLKRKRPLTCKERKMEIEQHEASSSICRVSARSINGNKSPNEIVVSTGKPCNDKSNHAIGIQMLPRKAMRHQLPSF